MITKNEALTNLLNFLPKMCDYLIFWGHSNLKLCVDGQKTRQGVCQDEQVVLNSKLFTLSEGVCVLVLLGRAFPESHSTFSSKCTKYG